MIIWASTVPQHTHSGGYAQQEVLPATWKISNIRRAGHDGRNVFGGLQSPQLYETITSFSEGFGKHLSSFGVPLSSGDCSLLHLLSLQSAITHLRPLTLVKLSTFSTRNLALSASCWATCFISTAWVNSRPKLKWVCQRISSKWTPHSFSLTYNGNVIENEPKTVSSLSQQLTDSLGHLVRVTNSERAKRGTLTADNWPLHAVLSTLLHQTRPTVEDA